MKTQVEFKSSKFPPYDGEPETINPGLWGQRLAEYLVQKFAEKGIEAEEMGAEDWGWYVPFRIDGVRIALCCGHQYGDDDQFLIFTNPKSPGIRRFFKKIDNTPQFTRLIQALQQILESDPEIRKVMWTEQR